MATNKERLNASIGLPTVRKADHLVATGRYRNRSHVVEAAIGMLYDSTHVETKRKSSYEF